MHGADHTATSQLLSPAASAAVETLAYYSIFSYPLTAEEIKERMRCSPEDAGDVELLLRQLEADGLISASGGYYSLQETGPLAARREKGNTLAQRRMPAAHKYSRIIYRFPFVRAVMLSGSISKGYMEPEGDIDYFIITHPGRLWIARTFLIFFKKSFLLNSRKNFCVNYFIDSDHLMIEDRNIFTATEAITLIPTCNKALYQDFMRSNAWTREYFPNAPLRDDGAVHPQSAGVFKRFFEWMLGGKAGNWMDDRFMRMTLKRWRKKFPGFSQSKFDEALRTRKYVSKHHPQDYRTRVINQLEEIRRNFEIKHQVMLRRNG